MLETIAVALVMIWALGLALSHSINGFIHGLLVAAIILTLIKIVQVRRIRRIA